MGKYCKNHIVVAMASGLSKAADGQVIIKKTTGKCEWSGCSTPDDDLHEMTYEMRSGTTTATEKSTDTA